MVVEVEVGVIAGDAAETKETESKGHQSGSHSTFEEWHETKSIQNPRSLDSSAARRKSQGGTMCCLCRAKLMFWSSEH